MDKKILGIIESIDDENRVVNFKGYGEYIGTFPKFDDEFGIEIDTPKVRFENDADFWIENTSFFSDKESIEEMITNYKNKGFTIKMC